MNAAAHCCGPVVLHDSDRSFQAISSQASSHLPSMTGHLQGLSLGRQHLFPVAQRAHFSLGWRGAGPPSLEKPTSVLTPLQCFHQCPCSEPAACITSIVLGLCVSEVSVLPQAFSSSPNSMNGSFSVDFALLLKMMPLPSRPTFMATLGEFWGCFPLLYFLLLCGPPQTAPINCLIPNDCQI